MKTSTFTFSVDRGEWTLRSANGDVTQYDKNGYETPTPIEDDDDAPPLRDLSRAARAAKQRSMPDEAMAKEIASEIQEQH